MTDKTSLEQTVNDTQTAFYEKGRILQILLRDCGVKINPVETYCQNTFGFGAERARQLIDAHKLYSALVENPTTASLLPANEAQIRPLSAIPVARQIEVWEYIIKNAPYGRITKAYVEGVCQQVSIAPDAPIRYLTAADVPDAAWSSENDLDIPLLSLRLQAQYCDLPFELWGATSRSTIAATWHFYTDDSRFTQLIDDPTPIVNSRCINAVEPNFSIYGQLPRVVGLHNIYHKRRIARWWQSQGIRIFVDMNVHPDFYEDNLLGVPIGWKAYATRGYSERLQDTIQEWQLACQRAESNDILFVVYGGGQIVKHTAKAYGWLWFPEESDRVRNREIASV